MRIRFGIRFEQAVIGPVGPPPGPHTPARVIAVGFARAEMLIGKRGGPGLHERARSILQNVREYRVHARTSKLAYVIARTTKPEHVSSSDANP